jgi:hypothetical protein
VPETAPLGTSMHRPLLPLTRLYWPEAWATACHCRSVAVVLQATWTRSALLAVDAPVTSTHLPLAPAASV